jgi:hypothetical protein
MKTTLNVMGQKQTLVFYLVGGTETDMHVTIFVINSLDGSPRQKTFFISKGYGGIWPLPKMFIFMQA